MPNSDKTTAGPEMCQECARDITDTFVTAMYTVGEHILGTDLFHIEIYADRMCHVNAASVAQCVCVSSSKVARTFNVH